MKCPKCQFENPSDSKFCKECGTQIIPLEEIPASPTKTLETPTEELTRGTTFAGRYEIIEELGKGGMGKVYRVEDKKIKEEVALKLIKPEIASDKKTIERFSNELRMARKISHRNVCRMYDLGEEKGTHYITMEYVPGEDLKSFIRRSERLTVGKAIFIAKQVCDGLAEAHRLGVIHRDLKPQNIMIDKEGNSRIMDFGIARSLKGKGITGAGVMIGTPEYMSPEQAEVKEVDQRSDIYSLGVILYEMVTGRVPFEGETSLGIAMKHKSETPKDPRELNPQISEDLSRLILRCLEKDKENRFQSAGEVRSELISIEEGIPTTERIEPKRKPITSKEITVTFRLRRLFIPAAVIAVLAIIVVVIWQPWSQKETVPIPSDKPFLAILYFQNNTGDESLDHWRSALSQWLITDLSQSKHINLLPVNRLLSILKKLNLLDAKSYATEDLKKVASECGANQIFQASFSKADDIFRIDYSLMSAETLESISSDYVKGKGEKSFPTMVDELTRRIKTSLKLSPNKIATDFDEDVGKITTASLEAYKLYTEGRKSHRPGQYRMSIQFMERAVGYDPDFAMAYRSMAAAYVNLRNKPKAKENIQKALDLKERLSERERLFIQAQYHSIADDFEKAIEGYKEFLEIYPDDSNGNNNLGYLYSRLEDWENAGRYLELAYQSKGRTYNIYLNLSSNYDAQGLYEKAREVRKDYLENVSEDAYMRANLISSYVYEGRYDIALEEADKAIALNPRGYNKRWIYRLRGDFAEVERESRKGLESDNVYRQMGARRRLEILYRAKGQFKEATQHAQKGLKLAEEEKQYGLLSWFPLQLAYISLIEGNLKEALKQCDSALEVAVQNDMLMYRLSILMRKGTVLAEMKLLDEAQKVAGELKEIVENSPYKKNIRYHYHLMGIIELKKENFPKAIEFFKKALSLIPAQSSELSSAMIFYHAIFMEPLALSYYKAGNLEGARQEYEEITKLSMGRENYGDIYAKSFYMLGKIHEQQGNKADAIKNYEKFLTLWKDADPGFTEVEGARKHLAELQSQ